MIIIYKMRVYIDTHRCKLVMGPGQNFLTRVELGQFFVARVSHLWFGFEFGNISPKNVKFFNFSLRVNKNLFGLGQKVPG